MCLKKSDNIPLSPGNNSARPKSIKKVEFLIVNVYAFQDDRFSYLGVKRQQKN